MLSNEMKQHSKQKGASGILILIFLGMTALILLAAFKLYPVYFDQWAIQSVADSFEESADLSSMSEREMTKSLQKRFMTNGIRDVKFEESIFVEKLEGEVIIDIDYERRVNIYKNIDAIVSFKEERIIKL